MSRPQIHHLERTLASAPTASAPSPVEASLPAAPLATHLCVRRRVAEFHDLVHTSTRDPAVGHDGRPEWPAAAVASPGAPGSLARAQRAGRRKPKEATHAQGTDQGREDL